jgi:hypothetical protein
VISCKLPDEMILIGRIIIIVEPYIMSLEIYTDIYTATQLYIKVLQLNAV